MRAQIGNVEHHTVIGSKVQRLLSAGTLEGNKVFLTLK